MGKIFIGAIKSQTPTFLPSPEPIAGMAKMAGLLASSTARTAAKSDGRSDKLPDMLHGQREAIQRQRADIDAGEYQIQQYALNTIKKDYGGDARKFIEGENAKYRKDGSGFYGKREELLRMDQQNKVNINDAKADKITWDKSASDLGSNQTEGDYFYMPNGQRITKGDGTFYKNQDWLTAQDQNLGVDSKGTLQRVSTNSTFKTGALEKEVMEIVKLGAVDQNISQSMGADGNLYTTKTNMGILGDKNRPNLASNLLKLLSRQASTELRNQFDLYADNRELSPAQKKGLTPAEQRSALFDLYVMNKVNSGADLMERFSQTRNSGKGTGSGGSKDEKPLGPVAAYAAGMPGTGIQRSREIQYDKSGNIIYAPSLDLSQMNSIDPKSLIATNDAYRKNIYMNQGTKPETQGEFFYGPDGTPNSTQIFKGKRAFIYNVENFQTNRVPVRSHGLNGDNKPSETFELAKNGQMQKQERLVTQTGQIAVHKDDLKAVLKGMRSHDTDKRSDNPGKFAYGIIEKGDLGNGGKPVEIGEKGSGENYYLINIELPAGNLSTYDAGTYLPGNAANANQDYKYGMNQSGNISDQSMNITY